MLEDIHSTLFNSPESVQSSIGDLKNLVHEEPSPQHNFTSLFSDLIGETFVDELNLSDSREILGDSDSNDDMVEYLTSSKNPPPLKLHINRTVSHPQRQFNSSLSENILNQKVLSHDCENRKGLQERMSNSSPIVPQIDIYELEEKGKSTNRNALNARMNRMRKKQYTSDLETKVEVLSKENEIMKEKLKVTNRALAEAQKEITYLRSVISNQNGLMSLLSNISNTAGVKLNASLVFADNNNDNHLTKSDTHVNMSTSCKRRLENNASDICDTVSVKRTRNGLYLVNEKENAKTNQVNNHADTVSVLDEKNHKDDITNSSEVLHPDLGYDKDDLQTTGGVCLHVSRDKVSIELCSHCATSAKTSWEIADDHPYFKPHQSVST